MSNSSFREAGWVWEGFATHAGVKPTLYGVGEGYRWFGVPGVNFMFHPNNETAFRKINGKDRVGRTSSFATASNEDVRPTRIVADISKWDFEYARNEGGYEIGFVGVHDPRPERIREEAENLSLMSTRFPNIVGGIIDDANGMFRHESYEAGGPAGVRGALLKHNPNLQLWAVVYANELDKPEWNLLKPHIDVVNLWLWTCQEIPNLAAHVAHCRRQFPDQQIIVGSYLHDFPSRANMPLDLLQQQYETMLGLWEQGEIVGYNILGAFYIDQAVEQAEWVREFLAER